MKYTLSLNKEQALMLQDWILELYGTAKSDEEAKPWFDMYLQTVTWRDNATD